MTSTSRTVCPDPALAAVRDCDVALRLAEVARVVAVLDWSVEHTTDVDPMSVTFGERALALGGVGCPLIEEFAAYDLAAALGMSSDSGLHLLARALELRHRLPRLWHAVVSGHLPVWKAGRIADSTMALSVEGAAYVDTRLGQAVRSISFAQVDRLVEEALARFDPDLLEERRAKAAEQRHVSIHLDQVGITGTVEIGACLDLADAVDLEDAVRAGATAIAAAGSSESLDVRRSMALGDLARGDQTLPLDQGGRDLVVHLHHDSPDVARCETTRSPITVEQIKAWCASGTKVVVKPVIDLDQHVHVGSYECPDRLREQTELRDHTCVFPLCTYRASRCDCDHVVPHGEGGATCTHNIAPLCRRHHRAKTHGRWRYDVLEPGAYLWVAPSGLHYRRDHTGTHPLDTPAAPFTPAEP